MAQLPDGLVELLAPDAACAAARLELRALAGPRLPPEADEGAECTGTAAPRPVPHVVTLT